MGAAQVSGSGGTLSTAAEASLQGLPCPSFHTCCPESQTCLGRPPPGMQTGLPAALISSCWRISSSWAELLTLMPQPTGGGTQAFARGSGGGGYQGGGGLVATRVAGLLPVAQTCAHSPPPTHARTHRPSRREGHDEFLK